MNILFLMINNFYKHVSETIMVTMYIVWNYFWLHYLLIFPSTILVIVPEWVEETYDLSHQLKVVDRKGEGDDYSVCTPNLLKWSNSPLGLRFSTKFGEMVSKSLCLFTVLRIVTLYFFLNDLKGT